jgi:murein DD-endopeptidase MepM/ murein hydrolase activator NlpD
MSGYWHLSQIDVQVGQTVERGEVLGRVGNTGLSTGAHLHWEMRVMGIPVDPLQWTRTEIR